MTVGDLNLRLPLERVASGQYQVVDIPELGIVLVGHQSWAVVLRGTEIPIGGVLEFTSLTEAHGKLADEHDAWRRRQMGVRSAA
jgi:hypothetical protein